MACRAAASVMPAVATALLLLGPLATWAAPAARPTVKVGGSTVVGLLSKEAEVALFRGIPFAQPPLGPLRFMPPKPIGKLPSPFDATGDPAGCIQQASYPAPNYFPPPNLSEDCLFVHVAAPLETLGDPTAKLPVMLFIHGGGYTKGSGSRDVLFPGYTPLDSLVGTSHGNVR
jgi:para-nitrobenzyl esterase